MAKWAMRALVVLSAASMAMAIAPVGSASAATKVVVCHATGSASNPYVKTVVDNNSTDYKGHKSHANDIIDPPGGTCPAPPPPGNGNNGNKDKITICHATGSATNPYQQITVPPNSGHTKHPDDIIPAPANGCPGPGYNPDDVELRAEFVGTNQVRFLLRGCPKQQTVTVTIGGVAVPGSFTVPNNDTLTATVAIPAGAVGKVIQIRCDRPLIIWEVIIGETPPVSGASPAAAAEPKPSTASNPAQNGKDKPAKSNGKKAPVPPTQLGFGLLSGAGMLAFSALRRKGNASPFGNS